MDGTARTEDRFSLPTALAIIATTTAAGCFIIGQDWLSIVVGVALMCAPIAVAAIYFGE